MTKAYEPSSNPSGDMSLQEARRLVDDYLDGLLTPEQESAFQRVVANDPSLQAELEVQGRVTASLQRLAQPPSHERFASMCEQARTDAAAPLTFPTSTRTRQRAIIGAIAAILMAAVGIALIWDALSSQQRSDSIYQQQAWRSLAMVYEDSLEKGFEPAWICADDAEFTETFENRYGQGLLMTALPENMKTLGLAYSNTLSPETIQLLARVDGRPVLVFIDQSSQAAEMPSETLEVQKPLNLHHRSLDELDLYELSPFESPQLLESFYNPVEARDP